MKLAYTLNDQQGLSTTKEKVSKGDPRSPTNGKTKGSSRLPRGACAQSLNASSNVEATADQACLQGFNAGFNVCKFIVRAHYPNVGEAIWSLIPWNTSPEEILDFVVQRKKRLEEALKLADVVLPPFLKK